MSWITCIWSMTAGICLALGAVHFLIWTRQRGQWANLVFSISAAAAAGYAILDMVALRAQTPAEYGAWMRWMLSLGMLEGVLVAWFIRLYLRAGRLWLLWLICGLRAVMLVLNFVSGPNFYFREITGLQQTPLLGEMISHAHGVLHPWAILMQLSLLLIVLFAIDAAHTAAKRGERRRAWGLGGLLAVGFSLALVSYALYALEIWPSTFSSQLFLSLILVMGYELSLDVLRAGQLSRELLETQQRMRLAASAADLSLWEWDIIRDEIWTTEKGRERAGIGASERIDFVRYLQSVHPDDREPTQRAVRHALEVSGEFEAEYRVLAQDGATRWIVARGQVERGAQGKPLRLRGVSVEVSERKQAEAELRRLQSELAHVSRVSTMGQIASSLAHELNQPLGAILRNAEAAQLLLQSDPPDLEEIRAILADICADDQRAGAVIDRTRAMLKRRELNVSTLIVDELVDEVVALTHSDAAGRQVRVEVQLASQLPALRGDRVQLQQVLLNLILNGMDAMIDVPTAERRLVVRARPIDGTTVEFEVSDSGPGIPADHLPHVFDPFFTTKRNGLGMGLPISRTIIEAHGGRLSAENNPDRGATFRFTVPVAAEGPQP
jgi:two-component system, LuxR family, sensor kinase FixL